MSKNDHWVVLIAALVFAIMVTLCLVPFLPREEPLLTLTIEQDSAGRARLVPKGVE